MTDWLPSATKVDLSGSRGNGPFTDFRGVILHVNVSPSGTSDDFWRSNSAQVCPNFQVYKDGSIHQMLPLNWQPWCQIDGNYNYAAIETAGMPDEPLTGAQVASIALILREYRDTLGMKLVLADSPGEYGLGTHKMGGPAWGGHECPGAVRTAQRPAILAAARGNTQKEFEMDTAATKKFAEIDEKLDKLLAGQHPKAFLSDDAVSYRRLETYLKFYLAPVYKKLGLALPTWPVKK